MSRSTSKNLNESKNDSLIEHNSVMTCKDGFCFLPNSEKNQPLKDETIDIFDPL